MRLRVLAAVAAVAMLASCTGGGARPARQSSTPAPTVASQRFVYAVEDDSSGTPHRTTVVVDVADPYVARIVNRDGPPPGGALVGGSAWGRSGLLVVSPDGSARQVQQVPPGFTGGDARLDVALPLATRLGWVRPLPTLLMAGGHRCTGWRSGSPLDSGSIDPPTPTEHTDSCVDGTGRIVSDRWTHDGRLLRTRQLVSSGVGPRLSLDGLDPTVTPSPLPSGTAAQLVRPVEAGKLAGLMGVRLPAAPGGLSLDRSTALVVTANGAAEQEGASFTYAGGGRLAVVTFTRFLVGAARSPGRGLPLRLARAAGRITPVVEGLQVDLVTRTGLAVKVQTDLPRAALQRWLRDLALP